MPDAGAVVSCSLVLSKRIRSPFLPCTSESSVAHDAKAKTPFSGVEVPLAGESHRALEGALISSVLLWDQLNARYICVIMIIIMDLDECLPPISIRYLVVNVSNQ